MDTLIKNDLVSKSKSKLKTAKSNSYIDDSRRLSDFRGITFSGFKISTVVKSLVNALNSQKIEDSCFWVTELVCSGHYAEIWEVIFLFYSKYVHIANPKLSILIWTKVQKFKMNMNGVETEMEVLDIRNDKDFRVMVMEIIVSLCISSKKYLINQVKISEGDFNMLNLKNILQAPDLSYSKNILLEDDPRELIITINELAYNLSKGVTNTLKAYYWVEWILEYMKLCKKRKETCKIQKRENSLIDEKYFHNPIWLVWKAVTNQAKELGGITLKVVESLFGMFCLRYTEVTNTKRRYTIYYAISILTTNIKYEEYEIVKDKKLLGCVLNQVDAIFMQVKEKAAQIQEQREREADAVDGKEPAPGVGGRERGKSDETPSEEKMRIINNFESGHMPRI